MTSGLRPYPEYKDSGLPWLGRIPAHWKLMRAKYLYKEVDERSQTGEEELCSVSHKTGVTPRKENVTMFMAESTVGYKICRPNDLAINTLWAWMAALGIARQVGVVSPAYGVYRPRPGSALVPDFADRMLRIEEYKAEYIARSTGVNASRLRLYPDQFLRIPLLLPTRDEQVAIVRYLDVMDRRIRRFIRNRRRLIEVLNEQKQAIINRAVARGLDPNAPLKPSGIDWLGDIPAHWAIAPIKRLFALMDYGISESARDVGRFRVLTMGHIRDGKVNIEGAGKVNDVPKELVLECKDLLFNRTNSLELVGKVGIFEGDSGDNITFASYLVRMRTNGNVEPLFAAYLLNSSDVLRFVRLHAIPSLHQANLNPTRYGRLKVPLPPRAEQREIVRHINEACISLNYSLEIAAREIALIREYRTRLIADVVTGKVDVRGIEVPEVAEEEMPALDEDTDESDNVIDEQLESEVEE